MEEKTLSVENEVSSLQRHTGFAHMFAPGEMTLGLILPIESYKGAVPTMAEHERLALMAEESGFAALWVRDVPLFDPSFGDVGQIYDPWVYLGMLAARTETIALGTASVIFTLRHPLHSAKSAASVDRLSGGRLVLGIATGDRPVEFPAFGVDFEGRSEHFREALGFFRKVTEESFPRVESLLGNIAGTDIIPKPVAGRIPVFVTGHSRQQLEWVAEHADGWLYYPQPPSRQVHVVRQWKDLVEACTPGAFKPFAQSLYIDLAADPGERPVPIHLGFSLGRDWLLELLQNLREIGVNHVLINLKYGRRPAGEVVEELTEHILPHFPTLMTVAKGGEPLT